MCLIAVNFVGSRRTLSRTGSAWATFPLTLCQLGLFTPLFYKIASHLGLMNYEVNAASSWWHWIEFTGIL